jgi:hypothetical protein
MGESIGKEQFKKIRSTSVVRNLSRNPGLVHYFEKIELYQSVIFVQSLC